MSPAAAPDKAERPAREDGSVPRHVAIIMDGNGRWAKKRGLPRVAGHRAGAEAVRRTLRAAVKNGIEVVTLYAFSSENWRRSEEEVSDLKGLLGYYLEREIESLAKEGVRLKLIGDYSAFGPDLSKRLEKAMTKLQPSNRLTLVVALNYGSRAEIAQAAQKLAVKVGEGSLDPSAIDESLVAAELQTNDLPELDLLIRTSGEVRLSNFLLWQAAYAELMFTPTLWPDFGEAEFEAAIDQYASRERRFGGR
ncbi:polyprenyl diphosphate synthase [Sphingomonas daechungensis]|uniref:polyprenyl diphosphate synthase n=1 Tax=Sphingomonas daechungensis TaxID=1176646 RepID=UPI0037836C89